MKRFLFPFLFIFFISACHPSQNERSTGDTVPADTTKKNYLPVQEYLKGEIAAVDSFPHLLNKYHFKNGKSDSGIITTSVFDGLAKEFLLSELDSSYFEKNFEENSFVDRSTDLISFTYSTKDTGNGLKRVDVLLTPGALASKLNSIYMETINYTKDSTIIRKMTWKAGKNFRILRILQPKTGKETSEQIFVDWDNRE